VAAWAVGDSARYFDRINLPRERTTINIKRLIAINQKEYPKSFASHICSVSRQGNIRDVDILRPDL
jgi:hypothetical protein